MASGEFSIDPAQFDWGTLMGTAPSEGPDPEVVARIRDAIDELPEVQRDVVNALFYEGLTISDTAEMLGSSRYHVYRALELAIERLREMLDDV